MIAITGASGHLGKATATRLAKKTDPKNIIAIVRDSAKAKDLADLGITLRVADYEDAASLEQALKGVQKLLQLSTSSIGDTARRQEQQVVAAARKQGVSHIIYTGSLKPSATAHFQSTRVCVETENAIIASGMDYTFFQDGLYMETIPLFIGEALQHGQLFFAAGKGRISFVSRLDIAEALSNVLSQEGHVNKQYEISGPQAVDFHELAALLTQYKNRPVEYVDIPNDVLREELLKAQMPVDMVEWYISLADSVKNMEFSYVDDTLEQLLGRKRTTLQEYLPGM